MYTEIEYEEQSAAGSRWLYLLLCLTGVPFFLHGYFPVALLLMMPSHGTDDAVSSVLFDNLLHNGVSLWPYCLGGLLGLGGSAYLADNYGRKSIIILSSWCLAALLLFLTAAPSSVVGTAAVTAVIPHPTGTMGDGYFEQLKAAFWQVSYAEMFIFMILGYFVTLLVQTSILFVVETSKPTMRGFDAAVSIRQILYGVAVACLTLNIFPATQRTLVGEKNDHSEAFSHHLHFRVPYAVPLLFVVVLGIFILVFPESPYWLMAQKTPPECIDSLRKLRQTNAVGQEYEALYHGASDEARRDSGWRSLITELPFRYVVCIGALLQAAYVLGAMLLFILQGPLFLKLCGLSEDPDPIVSTYCMLDYGAVDGHALLTSVRYNVSALLAPVSAAIPLVSDQINIDYTEYVEPHISLTGFGLCLGLFGCLLGSYAGSRHLHHRGSRRVQLIVNMVAMCLCLLGLSYTLAGDQALKQLNFDTSVAVRHLAEKYTRRVNSKTSEPVPSVLHNRSFTQNYRKNFTSVHFTETVYPTEFPTIEPSNVPTKHIFDAPTVAPTISATISPLEPAVSMDYEHSGSVKTSRVVILVCIFFFLFFFWAGVGLLSWLLTVESFPMRIRAKGTAVVFAIGALISFCGYFVLRWPLYVSMPGSLPLSTATSRASRNHTVSSPDDHEAASLICFNHWVRADGPIDLSATLFLLALATLLLAVYFFLALPETDGKMLTEMDDLFDVNDFDLCVGCCPHGQASGFLGVRVGHGLTRDFVTQASERYNHASLSTHGGGFAPRSGTNETNDAEQCYGGYSHFSFLPGSAFDTGHTDIERTRNSVRKLTVSENLKLRWNRVKEYFGHTDSTSSSSQHYGVPETLGARQVKEKSSTSTDMFRELTSDALAWDDNSTGMSPSPAIGYGSVNSSTEVIPDMIHLSTNTGKLTVGASKPDQMGRVGRSKVSNISETQRKSASSSPVIFMGDALMSGTGNAKTSGRYSGTDRIQPKKYSMNSATFQYDDDDDDDSYFF